MGPIDSDGFPDSPEVEKTMRSSIENGEGASGLGGVFEAIEGVECFESGRDGGGGEILVGGSMDG